MAEAHRIRVCGAYQYPRYVNGVTNCGYSSKNCPYGRHLCSKCGKGGHGYHDCRQPEDLGDDWCTAVMEHGPPFSTMPLPPPPPPVLDLPEPPEAPPAKRPRTAPTPPPMPPLPPPTSGASSSSKPEVVEEPLVGEAVSKAAPKPVAHPLGTKGVWKRESWNGDCAAYSHCSAC